MKNIIVGAALIGGAIFAGRRGRGLMGLAGSDDATLARSARLLFSRADTAERAGDSVSRASGPEKAWLPCSSWDDARLLITRAHAVSSHIDDDSVLSELDLMFQKSRHRIENKIAAHCGKPSEWIYKPVGMD